MTRTRKLLVVLAVVVVAGGMAAESMRSDDDRKAWEAAGDLEHAFGVCFRAAKKVAHDPSSMTMVDDRRTFKWSADKSSARVSVGLRGKNSFNAVVLTEIQCELRKSGQSWDVVSAKMGA